MYSPRAQSMKSFLPHVFLSRARIFSFYLFNPVWQPFFFRHRCDCHCSGCDLSLLGKCSLKEAACQIYLTHVKVHLRKKSIYNMLYFTNLFVPMSFNYLFSQLNISCLKLFPLILHTNIGDSHVSFFSNSGRNSVVRSPTAMGRSQHQTTYLQMFDVCHVPLSVFVLACGLVSFWWSHLPLCFRHYYVLRYHLCYTCV